MKKVTPAIIIPLLIVVLVSLVVFSRRMTVEPDVPVIWLPRITVVPPAPKPGMKWNRLTVGIDMSEKKKSKSSLLIGYYYFLTCRFIASRETEADFLTFHSDSACLASLISGKVDIAVIPVGHNFRGGNIKISSPIDGTCRLMMRASSGKMMKEAEEWIEYYNKSGRRESSRTGFFDRKNSISPYDSLIKIHAKTIGWDWKLFAALIYQESFFHIEAKSHAGARGLCQFMPKTAKAFGISNTLDPEQSIRGGARYLRKLSRHYHEYDKDERLNFTIAAYNAGEGRLQECMEFAEKCGLDPSKWDDVRKGILYMNADSFPVVKNKNDTVYIRNSAPRDWTETAYYVDKIKSRYLYYKERDIR